MEPWVQVDWQHACLPPTPVLELVVRGSVIYLALFLRRRRLLKRQSGTLGLTDLLVVVLIADAAQNAMANESRSITAGLVLVATIIGWSDARDWLGYWCPRVERFIHPPALPLVQAGHLLRHPRCRALVTEEELLSQLREQGIHELTAGKLASMEGDGRISVIVEKTHPHGSLKRPALWAGHGSTLGSRSRRASAWERTGHRRPSWCDGRPPRRNGHGTHDTCHKASGVSARPRDESVRAELPLGRPAHCGGRV